MEYRQHTAGEVLLYLDYTKHVQAMTAEKLHDKGEIAEELAVRDMRIKELESQLAASKAYAAQLREALEICKKEMQGDKWDSLYIDGILSLPQDDTALREWGAKLLEEMAEILDRGADYELYIPILRRKAAELMGQ